MLDTYERSTRGDENTELMQTGKGLKARADQIASEALQTNRDKVLEFLGIDPDAGHNLYYFVSWNMPLEMLRSYVIEAMWSGGTLIFKGIPPGKDMATFMRTDLQKLVYNKGAAANVSLDPRMFDAYGVDTVPTIVLTTYRAEFECTGVKPITFEYAGQTLSYDSCPALDSDKYWKMEGAVTTSYALQAFIDDGASVGKPYLNALAKGYAEGIPPGKAQTAFAGNWDEVLSPLQRFVKEHPNGPPLVVVPVEKSTAAPPP
jgi:type-F conjugative transfer system pilin assembly protein TrbC